MELDGGKGQAGDHLGLLYQLFGRLAWQAQNKVPTYRQSAGCCTLHGLTSSSKGVATVDAAQRDVTTALYTILDQYKGGASKLLEVV